MNLHRINAHAIHDKPFNVDQLQYPREYKLNVDWQYYVKGVNYFEPDSFTFLFEPACGILTQTKDVYPVYTQTLLCGRNIFNVISETEKEYIVEALPLTKKAPYYLTTNQYSHPQLVHKIYFIDDAGFNHDEVEGVPEILFAPLMGDNIPVPKTFLTPISADLPRKCTVKINNLMAVPYEMTFSYEFLSGASTKNLLLGDEVTIHKVNIFRGLWGKISDKDDLWIPLRRDLLSLANTTDWKI